jgi:Zn ribbon nucleic-acid-binding protein
MSKSTITSTEYCIQGQHFVPKEKITMYYTGKVKRRMCVDCKHAQIDRQREAKERARNGA